MDSKGQELGIVGPPPAMATSSDNRADAPPLPASTPSTNARTAAPPRRIIKTINLDFKKLKEAGLDRKLAEVLSKQNPGARTGITPSPSSSSSSSPVATQSTSATATTAAAAAATSAAAASQQPQFHKPALPQAAVKRIMISDSTEKTVPIQPPPLATTSSSTERSMHVKAMLKNRILHKSMNTSTQTQKPNLMPAPKTPPAAAQVSAPRSGGDSNASAAASTSGSFSIPKADLSVRPKNPPLLLNLVNQLPKYRSMCATTDNVQLAKQQEILQQKTFEKHPPPQQKSPYQPQSLHISMQKSSQDATPIPIPNPLQNQPQSLHIFKHKSSQEPQNIPIQNSSQDPTPIPPANQLISPPSEAPIIPQKSPSPPPLIVLENKVLAPEEKIDLSNLGLPSSTTIVATILKTNSQSAAEAVIKGGRVIMNASKFKVPPNKLAEMAQEIRNQAQQVKLNTQPEPAEKPKTNSTLLKEFPESTMTAEAHGDESSFMNLSPEVQSLNAPFGGAEGYSSTGVSPEETEKEKDVEAGGSSTVTTPSSDRLASLKEKRPEEEELLIGKIMKMDDMNILHATLDVSSDSTNILRISPNAIQLRSSVDTANMELPGVTTAEGENVPTKTESLVDATPIKSHEGEQSSQPDVSSCLQNQLKPATDLEPAKEIDPPAKRVPIRSKKAKINLVQRNKRPSIPNKALEAKKTKLDDGEASNAEDTSGIIAHSLVKENRLSAGDKGIEVPANEEQKVLEFREDDKQQEVSQPKEDKKQGASKSKNDEKLKEVKNSNEDKQQGAKESTEVEFKKASSPVKDTKVNSEIDVQNVAKSSIERDLTQLYHPPKMPKTKTIKMNSNEISEEDSQPAAAASVVPIEIPSEEQPPAQGDANLPFQKESPTEVNTSESTGIENIITHLTAEKVTPQTMEQEEIPLEFHHPVCVSAAGGRNSTSNTSDRPQHIPILNLPQDPTLNAPANQLTSPPSEAPIIPQKSPSPPPLIVLENEVLAPDEKMDLSNLGLPSSTSIVAIILKTNSQSTAEAIIKGGKVLMDASKFTAPRKKLADVAQHICNQAQQVKLKTQPEAADPEPEPLPPTEKPKTTSTFIKEFPESSMTAEAHETSSPVPKVQSAVDFTAQLISENPLAEGSFMDISPEEQSLNAPFDGAGGCSFTAASPEETEKDVEAVGSLTVTTPSFDKLASVEEKRPEEEELLIGKIMKMDDINILHATLDVSSDSTNILRISPNAIQLRSSVDTANMELSGVTTAEDETLAINAESLVDATPIKSHEAEQSLHPDVSSKGCLQNQLESATDLEPAKETDPPAKRVPIRSKKAKINLVQRNKRPSIPNKALEAKKTKLDDGDASNAEDTSGIIDHSLVEENLLSAGDKGIEVIVYLNEKRSETVNLNLISVKHNFKQVPANEEQEVLEFKQVDEQQEVSQSIECKEQGASKSKNYEKQQEVKDSNEDKQQGAKEFTEEEFKKASSPAKDPKANSQIDVQSAAKSSIERDLTQLYHPPKMPKTKTIKNNTNQKAEEDTQPAATASVSLIEILSQEQPPAQGDAKLPFRKESPTEVNTPESTGIQTLITHLSAEKVTPQTKKKLSPSPPGSEETTKGMPRKKRLKTRPVLSKRNSGKEQEEISHEFLHPVCANAGGGRIPTSSTSDDDSSVFLGFNNKEEKRSKTPVRSRRVRRMRIHETDISDDATPDETEEEQQRPVKKNFQRINHVSDSDSSESPIYLEDNPVNEDTGLDETLVPIEAASSELVKWEDVKGTGTKSLLDATIDPEKEQQEADKEPEQTESVINQSKDLTIDDKESTSFSTEKRKTRTSLVSEPVINKGEDEQPPIDSTKSVNLKGNRSSRNKTKSDSATPAITELAAASNPSESIEAVKTKASRNSRSKTPKEPLPTHPITKSEENKTDTPTQEEPEKVKAAEEPSHSKKSERSRNRKSTIAPPPVPKEDPKLEEEIKNTDTQNPPEITAAEEPDQKLKMKRKSRSKQVTGRTADSAVSKSQTSQLGSEEDNKSAEKPNLALTCGENNIPNPTNIDATVDEDKPSSSMKSKRKRKSQAVSNTIAADEIKPTASLADSQPAEIDTVARGSRRNYSRLSSVPQDTSASAVPKDEVKTDSVPKRGRKSRTAAQPQNLSETLVAGKELDPNAAAPSSSKRKRDASADTSAEPTQVAKKLKTEGKQDFNQRLLLIRHREQLDSDEVLTDEGKGKGPLQCGLCLARSTEKNWQSHLAEHYGVGWLVGETPNITRAWVLKIMKKYIDESREKLTCRLCQRQLGSHIGMIGHLEGCGNKQRVECDLCKRSYAKLSFPIHRQSCSTQQKRREDTASPFNLRLLLIRKREQLDSEEVLTEEGKGNGPLQCGLCLAHSTKVKWQSHLEEHYGVGWLVGETPKIITRNWVMLMMKAYLEESKKKLVCRLCEHQLGSALGMMLHLESCGNKQRVECGICKRSYTILTLPAHYRDCLRRQQLAEMSMVKAEQQKAEDDSETVLSNAGRAKRKSTIKAETKLKNIDEHTSVKNEFDGHDSSDYDIANDKESSEEYDSEGVDSNEDSITPEQDGSECEKSKPSTKRPSKKRPGNSVEHATKPLLLREESQKSSAPHKWKEFLKINYSEIPLYCHLVPGYSMLSLEDAQSLLPSKEQTSVRYAYGGASQDSDWQRLAPLEGFNKEGEYVGYLGGPVRQLAWAPLPSNTTDQYLLCSLRSRMKSYARHFKLKQEDGLLILLKCTEEPSNDKTWTVRPELHYGIRVPNGPVHSFAFLPSGGYDPATNRLGLLAVANATSDVHIYAVPLKLKDEEKYGEKVVIQLEPVITLSLDVDQPPAADQCTKICWSEASGHNFLATGYASGRIALWDIGDTDSINCFKRNNNQTNIFVPSNTLYLGERNIQFMELHYDMNGIRWLAAGSSVRKFMVYDIINWSQPTTLMQNTWNNIFLGTFHWSPVSEAIILSSTNYKSRAILVNPTGMEFKTRTLDNTMSASRSMHTNCQQNYMVLVTDIGDLAFLDTKAMTHGCHLAKTMINYRAVSTTKLQHLGSGKPNPTDVISADEFHRDYGVQINPLVKANPQSARNCSYLSEKRLPSNPHSLALTRNNCVRCNWNSSAHSWVAMGAEHGLLRILNFKRNNFL
ncbi:hypothetical protein KR032_009186 [Drosophila birchii]|nr:hypothetical protein KR032_009186 [Drosophila birchii]